MSVFTLHIAASWNRLPPNLRGILWITMGTVAFAFNDAVIKTLGREINPLELAFFRYTTGMIILAPIFKWPPIIAASKVGGEK